MPRNTASVSFVRPLLAVVILVAAASLSVAADRPPATFATDVLPALKTYCVDCHNAKVSEGNTRLDDLNPDLVGGPDAERWHHALNMINLGKMPPKDAKKVPEARLVRMIDWIQTELAKAIKAHRTSSRNVIRRLTRQQYTNTLQELLGLSINFGQLLPEDGKSKSGFSNNATVLQATPLHLEYYQSIARRALDQAIFTEKPAITRYRIRIGTGIGKGLAKGKAAGRFGGYVSQPVDPQHLVAEVLGTDGRPITVDPATRTGPYANILQNLGIGMRGSHKHRYQVTEGGMLLDSAVPHREVAPGSWHGPSPNLKMLIRRDFPAAGDFVLRVRAASVAKRNEELPASYNKKQRQTLLMGKEVVSSGKGAVTVTAAQATDLYLLLLTDGRLVPNNGSKMERSAKFGFDLPARDVYHVDVVTTAKTVMRRIDMNLEVVGTSGRLMHRYRKGPVDQERVEKKILSVESLGILDLPKGQGALQLKWKGGLGVERVVLTPLAKNHAIRKERAEQLARLKSQATESGKRKPVLQVSLGNRTDDGQDARRFDSIQPIKAADGKMANYEFFGRLENLPVPQVDLAELSNLANIMVLTVWNGDFVKDQKQPGSRVLVESMEFEAPYFSKWPPASHTGILFDSPNRGDESVYTREVLQRFLRRAFRRPPRTREVDLYHAFWKDVRGEFKRYEDSVKEVLVAVLCSPKFLFLAESNAEKKTEQQREYELASRLSYFLWNSPPDRRLYDLADSGRLRKSLAGETRRMVGDPRIRRFVESFCDEWLKLYRHKEMQVDVRQYGGFTRFVKEDMAKETYGFVQHCLQKDLGLFTLIDSDFVMINQNLAEFYGISGVQGTEFRPVKVAPEVGRGGLLTQGSFLSGHSDGRHAHPIKRAVWMMERILGESPPPPPPNVPGLEQKEKDTRLTIAQQLVVHRENVSCRNCHQKLDPYGLIFEDYNGAGLLKSNAGKNPDTRTKLPGGTVVDGVTGMKAHILKSQRKGFTRSLVEHLLVYALGRDMSFVDEPAIERIVSAVTRRGGSMRVVMEEIVQSPLFLQEQPVELGKKEDRPDATIGRQKR